MAEFISSKTITKRKPDSCIWCGEPIARGESCLEVVSAEDGEIGTCYWHPECDDACQKMMQRDRTWGEPFEPYEFARGTNLCKHDYRIMQQQQPNEAKNP